MKKLILRLLISGVVIAAVAVAVILIFFQKKPLEAAYLALVDALSANGVQTKMENYLASDSDFADICSDDYKLIMKSEFDMIKNEYTKLPLVETDKDYDSLLEATNNYIEAVTNTNVKIEVFKSYKKKLIDNYKEANGGNYPPDNSYQDVAYHGFKDEIRALISEQVNSAMLLNQKMLTCLEEGYYNKVYNYQLALDKTVYAYSKYALENAVDGVIAPEKAATVATLGKLIYNNKPAVKDAAAANLSNEAVDFVNSIAHIDIYLLASQEESYIAGLSAEKKVHANNVKNFIVSLPEAPAV